MTQPSPLDTIIATARQLAAGEAAYRDGLDRLNQLGASNEQIATVAINRRARTLTALTAGSLGPRGATPADLARAAVEALEHCGRLAKENPMPTVEDADAFAAKAHAGQTDKAGRPYVEHVRTVASLLRHHGDHAVMAGLLHDVVEDTTVTLDELRRLAYPEDVVRAVDSVTRREDEDYYDMVRRAAVDPLGRLVKLADNATNADENRLELLPAKVADRLRRKYAKAREILLAAELSEPGRVTEQNVSKLSQADSTP